LSVGACDLRQSTIKKAVRNKGHQNKKEQTLSNTVSGIAKLDRQRPRKKKMSQNPWPPAPEAHSFAR